MNDIYKGAFTAVKTGDPDYYNDVSVEDMMTELGQPTHVPWFQQAYNRFVEGQRFASQIPGTRTYTGLTLGNRHQATKLDQLQRDDIHDTSRFLTEKQRTAGLKEPPAWYLPRDEADYYMQTGQLPKALAANAAYADLQGVRVPHRLDNGTYVDEEGDVMSHDDMADYFARLRAARAPPVPVAAAPPPPSAQPAPPPLIIAEPTNNGKRRKVQQTLDGMV